MKIFYTGIGCNKTGEHTENEFLHLFTFKTPITYLTFVLSTIF